MNAKPVSPKQEVWSIEAALEWATEDLRKRYIEQPRLDAEVLLAHALHTTRIQLILEAHRILEPSELARFRACVLRRRTREPVAYICGEKEFYGRSFQVDARVLVPRPETEILVDTVLRRIGSSSLSLCGLDLCTGSGCIAITLAREWPTTVLYAVDISPSALEVAHENKLRLGAHNVVLLEGDLFKPVEGYPPFDLIVANPPYIAQKDLVDLMPDVRLFEPYLALEAGEEGLDKLQQIIVESPRFLREGGFIAVEVGRGQAECVKDWMESVRLQEIEITYDYTRVERIVSAMRH
ncbi:peptide chain release factor N(5)-glutamine methyltransferase [Pajaroellobacter abortibovis]|uniref:Release factor glutamine methyltransferase n=1 Tax=Pajaroellobacter abortibovis TaxID=1882918 RepID=A0A1L6MUX7_9BACT|nr:peptide chain release factor N(5)-glutamine methyltransferase [Pajaroellobacter abortibovis]APR99319.1 protein-(glutamine-N5) methyltransferase, release factor-specific [Pajaroellobacter abortibovis]